MSNEEVVNIIVVDPNIRFGKPCIKGTRITVSDVLQWFASGMSAENILADYSELTQQHLTAALTFAARRDGISRIIAA